MPIGGAIPSAQATILSEALRPCGLGELGEICIRTPFSTFGYLADPLESATRFVLNPYGTAPVDALYRTGDCGRYRLDGTLEIVGRMDHQLKVHGTRIDPIEIALAVEMHPDVVACVVMASEPSHGGDDDEPRLIAYLTASAGSHLTSSDLRLHLHSLLPATMIPSSFVLLDDLPRTQNGKLDRKALRALQPAPSARATIEARDPIEGAVLAIWRRVLNAPAIGVTDDFFESGGHSLAALRIAAEIERELGEVVKLMTFFEASSVEAMAARIRSKDG
jgi:acyl-CoA synthetase (AMP-forming)/AMP-acid ligase II